MHIRLPFPHDDFMILSPLNPLKDLADYQCFKNVLHWLFCKKCGVRCFTFAGEGELVDRDVGGSGERVTVWSPLPGFMDTMTTYLSVNAYTIEPGQEGFDLREWTEKKWVEYLDCLDLGGEKKKLQTSFDRPPRGGAY